MEYIRSTPTGAYYRMDDGRIGYANNNGYARISVAREGLRNGEWFNEPNEIGDRAYQINKKIKVERTYGDWVTTGYERVKFKNIVEAIDALVAYNKKNCQPINVLKRERDTWRSFYKGNLKMKEYYQRKITNLEADRDYYADRYTEGKNEILNQLSKILINNE